MLYWQVDGGAIQSSLYSYVREDSTSVTSFLVFSSVTADMDGNYVCAINFDGQVFVDELHRFCNLVDYYILSDCTP